MTLTKYKNETVWNTCGVKYHILVLGNQLDTRYKRWSCSNIWFVCSWWLSNWKIGGCTTIQWELNSLALRALCLEVSKLNRSKNLRTEDQLKTKKILVNKKETKQRKKEKKIHSICYGSNCPAFKFYVKTSEQLNAWSFYKCDFIKKTSHQKQIECHDALNGKLKKTKLWKYS